MARIYDEKEIEDLERQATLKQRKDAAMKILEPERPYPVAAMREHEEQRRADWHKSNMDARARRLEGMVATEAGRYNPQQQAAALKWLEGNGYGQEGERRRQFDVTNETERIKAREHANGLINQGKTQAEIKAAAEREMSRNKDGWWDDHGNFHPGASVRSAEAGGTWRLEQQKLKNEGAVTVQDKRNEGAATVQDKKNQGLSERNQTLENITTTRANATVEAARARQQRIDERLAQKDVMREQKDFEEFLVNLNNGNITLSKEERKSFKAMTPDEQKAFWKKKVGRENGEEENPNIQTDKQGVKWEIVFDANGNKIGRKRVK